MKSLNFRKITAIYPTAAIISSATKVASTMLKNFGMLDYLKISV